jgi:hypothetical protein
VTHIASNHAPLNSFDVNSHLGGPTMALNPIRETFRRAVEILVDENEKLKERLLIAYASQLSQIRPSVDLPAELVDEFQWLRYALSDAEMPYGFGQRAAKKLREMSDQEASELARTVLSMFLRIRALESAAID